MADSVYKIQVVDKRDGSVVAEWPPGLHAEKDIIASLANRVRAKGVGFGRTQAHVYKDVVDAFNELLLDLKRTVRQSK